MFRMVALLMAIYGEEVWSHGGSKALKVAETTRNILTRKCINNLWFLRNTDIKKDLQLQDILEVALDRRNKSKEALATHPDQRVHELAE